MQIREQSAYWMGVLGLKNWLRIVSFTLLLCASNLYAESQRLIVNASHVENSLSRNTARAIFSMRVQRWNDGTPIRGFCSLVAFGALSD